MTKSIAGAEVHGDPTVVLQYEDFLHNEPLVTDYSEELDISVEVIDCSDDMFDLYVYEHLD